MIPPPDTPFEHDRRILPFVLKERGLLQLGAEIGVCKGIFSEHILTHWPGTLLCIDPWMSYEGYGESQAHENNYLETIQRLAPFKDRARIRRQTSLEAIREVIDDSLDFCYIDANHSYEAVRDDLNAWYPKVKRGGILCGDDYTPSPEMKFGNGLVYGVTRAVNEFALQHQKNVSIDWTAWWSFEMDMAEDYVCRYKSFMARNWWFVK